MHGKKIFFQHVAKIGVVIGTTTLSITTFSIMTFSIRTFSITTFSITTLSIKTLCITVPCEVMLSVNIQSVAFFILLLSVTMLSAVISNVNGRSSLLIAV